MRHPPDAGMAAKKRDCERFILRGFSRERQLDIDFNTIPFGAFWLRRQFTNERHPHITNRARTEEDKQPVRYGNNIAVLFRACHSLRHAYPSYDFWSAIAREFGAPIDAVKRMVSVFEQARIAFCQANPGAKERIGKTGTNVAVDIWLDNLENLRDISRRQNRQYSTYPKLIEDAADFFKGQERSHVDLGCVLPKDVDYQHYSPPSRKRSASPSSIDRSRSPKRRLSSTHYGQADLFPPQPQQPSTPQPKLQIKGSATKKEYQTSVSASDQISPGDPFPRDPADVSELFQKVRGTAQKDRNGTPSTDMLENTSRRMSSGNSLDDEKYHAEHMLDLKDSDAGPNFASLLTQECVAKLTTKMLALEKTVALAAPESSIVAMQAQITSLVQQVKSVEENNVALKKQLAEVARSSLERDDKIRDTSLACLQTTDVRLTKLESGEVTESNVSSVQKLETRIACLEDKSQTKTSDTAQTDQTKHRGVWQYAQGLDDRIRKMEVRPNEGVQLGDIAGKAATTENRLDKLEHQAKDEKKAYASKGFIEEKLKQLENRHSRDIEATAKLKHVQRIQEQIKALQDQSTNREIEILRLSKTVDMLGTPKSPPPTETSSPSLDEMANKIAALSKAKSEKLFQVESGLRNEIEEHQKGIDQKLEASTKGLNASIEAIKRSVEELSTKTSNLPSMLSINANISDRMSKIDSTLRAEVEREHLAMHTSIEKFGNDLGTLTAQFKGLNKMWNKTIHEVSKAGSVVADMDATKAEVASLSKKLSNFANQGLDASMKDIETKLDKLDESVYDLQSQVNKDMSPGVSLADLSARLDEQKREIDRLRSHTEGLGDRSDLDERITGVAKIVESLIQHLET